MRDMFVMFFFFNDTAPTEIYTLSLHDALPILRDVDSGVEARHDEGGGDDGACQAAAPGVVALCAEAQVRIEMRSEEHTSELQSLAYLVCRLLLEKKKKNPMKDHDLDTQEPTND